ncbi:MAG: hypothetical protein KUL75_05745 [Sterolibacterium sp.]|nr:hypothetical protein [Sterolibacterium sp.]
MTSNDEQVSTSLKPVTWAWLALVALTLISLELGQWLHGVGWLQLIVAAIIWLKGMLVARGFIESQLAYPLIRNILLAFISFAPLALILIAFFGREFARWTTL